MTKNASNVVGWLVLISGLALFAWLLAPYLV